MSGVCGLACTVIGAGGQVASGVLGGCSKGTGAVAGTMGGDGYDSLCFSDVGVGGEWVFVTGTGGEEGRFSRGAGSDNNSLVFKKKCGAGGSLRH